MVPVSGPAAPAKPMAGQLLKKALPTGIQKVDAPNDLAQV